MPRNLTPTMTATYHYLSNDRTLFIIIEMFGLMVAACGYQKGRTAGKRRRDTEQIGTERDRDPNGKEKKEMKRERQWHVLKRIGNMVRTVTIEHETARQFGCQPKSMCQEQQVQCP
jgi:hypothetical protein